MDLSLTRGLNLPAVVCGIFWSSSPGVFSWYFGFLPSFIGLMVQSIKKKAQINAISTLSNLIAELSLRTAWQVTWHVTRNKCLMCSMWFAHDCARATWVCALETVRGAVRRCQKSRIVPLNVIIIIIILQGGEGFEMKNGSQLHLRFVNNVAVDITYLHDEIFSRKLKISIGRRGEEGWAVTNYDTDQLFECIPLTKEYSLLFSVWCMITLIQIVWALEMWMVGGGWGGRGAHACVCI